MPLPLRLLDVEVDGDAVRPRFLGRADERWIGAVLGVVEDLAGKRAQAADEAFRGAVLGIGRAFGVAPRVLALLFRLERARFGTRVDAPSPPETIRDVLFELAATLPRGEALRRAAVVLGVDALAMERALFADRRGARVLVAPDPWSTPTAAWLRYNHALAGALLARASHVTALVAGDARWIAARAKRLGLSVSLTAGIGVVHVAVAGPLAHVHATTKYGRALARLVPLLVATGAWSLVADVVLGETTRRLDLDATAPLGELPVPRAAPLPLARRLARELARTGSPWRVAAAGDAVRVGARIFYPELALEGPRRVLVEVLPPSSDDVVAEVRATLAAAPVPVVVCVEGVTDARALVLDASRALSSSR